MYCSDTKLSQGACELSFTFTHPPEVWKRRNKKLWTVPRALREKRKGRARARALLIKLSARAPLVRREDIWRVETTTGEQGWSRDQDTKRTQPFPALLWVSLHFCFTGVFYIWKSSILYTGTIYRYFFCYTRGVQYHNNIIVQLYQHNMAWVIDVCMNININSQCSLFSEK